MSLRIRRAISTQARAQLCSVLFRPEVAMKTLALVKEPASHLLALHPELARANHILLQVNGVPGVVRRIAVMTTTTEVVHLNSKISQYSGTLTMIW